MKGYIDMGIKESISELRQKFDAEDVYKRQAFGYPLKVYF